MTTTVLIAGSVTLADEQASIVAVLDKLERRRAASKATRLSAGEVQRVLQRATDLRRRGRLDDTVSLLQRAVLLTDDPEPRFALANAHHARGRLYASFAETAQASAPKRAAGYTAHAKKEAAAAARLRAQAHQLAFDQADVDGDARISDVEGAALLQRLGGRRAPGVRFTGLSDMGVAFITAAAAATARTGDPLVVTGGVEKASHTDAIDIQLPRGRRGVALKRAVEAQLRHRGVPLGAAAGQYRVAIESAHLHIGPTRP